MNKDFYKLSIEGISRELPIIQISPSLKIASFNMLGDTELIEKTAERISREMPEGIDIIVCPEAKSIPLVHSIAIRKNIKNYIVLRKSVKGYMKDPISMKVNSITTKEEQILVLDGVDRILLKNKKVAIIDDVVSTGGSLLATENLLKKAGANVVWKGAVLLEGNKEYKKLFYIEKLPIWQKNNKE